MRDASKPSPELLEEKGRRRNIRQRKKAEPYGVPFVLPDGRQSAIAHCRAEEMMQCLLELFS
jgi:hypothetical protein